MKKDGKTKAGASHVPQFSPSYTHTPRYRCSSHIIDTHKIIRVYGLGIMVWGLGFIKF
jgi:hypothetical protein